MVFEVFQIETTNRRRRRRRRRRLRMRRRLLICSSQRLRRLSNSRRLAIFSSRLRRRLLICSSQQLRRLPTFFSQLLRRLPFVASKHKTRRWRRCKMVVSYCTSANVRRPRHAALISLTRVIFLIPHILNHIQDITTWVPCLYRICEVLQCMCAAIFRRPMHILNPIHDTIMTSSARHIRVCAVFFGLA